jgi:hypothetical protein
VSRRKKALSLARRFGRRRVENVPELGEGHLQGVGELGDVHEGRIAFTPFNATHVGPMQTSSVGQLLLRQAEPMA